MQVSGRVTRVAGLVMECVGLRLAVGSACTIPLPNGAKIEAEVVGFEGERLFLMPQSDVEGVVPGSRVHPVEPSIPRPGSVTHPRRRPSDRARHLPVGWKLLGPRGRRRRPSARRQGTARHRRSRADQRPPRQSARPRADQGHARRRRARDQCDADRRPRPAPGPVRRHRRRQIGAARHDRALHDGRRDRRRPDRRTRAAKSRNSSSRSWGRKAWPVRPWSPPRPTARR